jgi:hypothetical protein
MDPESFLTSLAGSLIAAAFVPFFIDVWSKYARPRLADMFYSGAKINGQWKAEAKYEEEGKSVTGHEMVDVNQLGNLVSGEMRAQLTNECAVYVFKGEIVNSILTASYWKKGTDSSHDRGTIALKVVDDDKLDGSFTYYEDNHIVSGLYSWKK